MNKQHLIQEEKEKLFDMFPVLKSVLEQTEHVSALKGGVTLMSMFEQAYELSLKRIHASAKREVIEEVEKLRDRKVQAADCTNIYVIPLSSFNSFLTSIKENSELSAKSEEK